MFRRQTTCWLFLTRKVQTISRRPVVRLPFIFQTPIAEPCIRNSKKKKKQRPQVVQIAASHHRGIKSCIRVIFWTKPKCELDESQCLKTKTSLRRLSSTTKHCVVFVVCRVTAFAQHIIPTIHFSQKFLNLIINSNVAFSSAIPATVCLLFPLVWIYSFSLKRVRQKPLFQSVQSSACVSVCSLSRPSVLI